MALIGIRQTQIIDFDTATFEDLKKPKTIEIGSHACIRWDS